jgi:hypothetical protein
VKAIKSGKVWQRFKRKGTDFQALEKTGKYFHTICQIDTVVLPLCESK